ncbi:hypothetical protein Tco_1010985 [Tanacetum coccineum]
MDSVIPLGQKNTLAEYMILSGADNRLPLLDKDLYDSWKSRMEIYMQNREHGRMILESVENDPLIWLTVKENGVTGTKKYVELSELLKIYGREFITDARICIATNFDCFMHILKQHGNLCNEFYLLRERNHKVSLAFIAIS